MRSRMMHLAGRTARRSLRLVAPFVPSEIPVLTYHSIDDTGSPISITSPGFRAHLECLKREGWRGLSMAEYTAAASAGRVPPRTLLITFDDGYRNFNEYALPLLKEYGFPATVFVPVDYVGRRPLWLARDRTLTTPLLDKVGVNSHERDVLSLCTEALIRDELMDWSDLRALVNAGIDIQSHSAAHHFLTQLPWDELLTDLRRSREELEDNLGAPVEAIAYPYGDSNATVARAAREVGFKVGFVSDHGPRDTTRMMSWRGGVSDHLSPVELTSLLHSWPLYPRLRHMLRRARTFS